MTILKFATIAVIARLTACTGIEPLPASDISESRDAELHRHAQYGNR